MIQDHNSHYSIYYGAQALSDHGPMYALALRGLGAAEESIQVLLEAYSRRLDPISAAPDLYRQYLNRYLLEVSELGMDTVIARDLPGLISGWVLDAYHPLIRLAYGHRFQIPGEVAAGLASMKYVGPDQTLGDHARNVRPNDSLEDAVTVAGNCAVDPGGGIVHQRRSTGFIQSGFRRGRRRGPG